MTRGTRTKVISLDDNNEIAKSNSNLVLPLAVLFKSSLIDGSYVSYGMMYNTSMELYTNQGKINALFPPLRTPCGGH